jgi:hypothetical protein
MNTVTIPGGKKLPAPSISSLSNGIRSEQGYSDRDESYKKLVSRIFKKNHSKPRFSVGDEAVVIETAHHAGFNQGETFFVTTVSEGWAYREDGNCLPYSCLANITLNEEEKQELDKIGFVEGEEIEGGVSVLG